mgnify:CR=1 FL=1
MSKSKEETAQYSKKTHVSYGIGGFLDNFFIAAFTVRVFNFYENEIVPTLVSTEEAKALGILLVGVAFMIFGFWNMINDPFIGYLSDKRYNFIKKWGRRFPWYAIGALSYSWVYLLIFIGPFNGIWGMFFWLLITICLFELSFTLWQANYLALFPEKFRSQKERTTVGLWTTIWGVIGIALGVLIPPLIIEYGNIGTYVITALLLAIVGFAMSILSLPGMKEDEQLIARELNMLEKQEQREQKSFFEVLKIALKNKNFVAYVITYFGHQVITVFMLGSLVYWNQYIIGSADSDLETIISAGFLFAVLGSAPIWAKVGEKVGNRKAYMYGTLMTTIFFIPMFFISDLLFTTIFIALIGIGIGAIWVLMYPGFSDVIDDIVVQTGEKQEGTLTGIRTFFGRAPIILQGALFSLIHIATGYKAGAAPGTNSQTALAEFGIRLHMVLIPMLFYFIGFLVMWKMYSLTMEKVRENKKQLEAPLIGG